MFPDVSVVVDVDMAPVDGGDAGWAWGACDVVWVGIHLIMFLLQKKRQCSSILLLSGPHCLISFLALVPLKQFSFLSFPFGHFFVLLLFPLLK